MSSLKNKSLKEILLEYRIVFFAYLLLIVVYLVFFCFLRAPTIAWLNDAFGDCSFGNGISTNLLASLITFGILGIVTMVVPTIISTKDPKDQELRDRIKALVNSEKIVLDDELYKFLKSHFTSFLAYNKETIIRIEIRDYDPVKKAFYVYLDIVSTLTNMCKDNDYSIDAKLFVVPDLPVNGDWGMLVKFETKNISTNAPKIPHFSAIKIEEKIEEKVRLQIPQNEEIEIRTEYIIWHQGGDSRDMDKLWYFIEVIRYTRRVEIVVINKLSSKKSLTFEARYAEKEVTLEENKYNRTPLLDGPFELQYDHSRMVKHISDDLYPGDRLEFFFNKPQ